MEYRVTEKGVEVGLMNIDSTFYLMHSGPKLLEIFSDLDDIMGCRVKTKAMGQRLRADLNDSQRTTRTDMRSLVQRKLEGFGYTLTS